MSSTQRRDKPSRSSSEAASRHKSYRFKSYLEANTQERARFESMQGELPDKIAEVIASFREDKLVVQPSHRRTAEAELVVEPVLQPARPRARAAQATPVVMPRSRVLWPWYVGAVLLALVAMIWMDTRADQAAQPPLTPLAQSPAAPVLEPVAAMQAPAADVETSAALPAQPARVSGALTAEPAPPAEPVKLAAAEPNKIQKRSKPAARKKAAENTAAGAHHYSEDLTGLLQGH